MKNTIYATFAALLCTTALSAQTPAGSATAPGQMDTAKMDKGKMADAPMTVTGCIAQGADTNQFTLTNATMSNMPAGKMDSGAMKSDSAKAATMTYELDGGTNLKAHMGHKVDITGTMDKKATMSHDTMAKPGATADKDKMGSMDKTGSMAHKGMMAGKIKVTAMKMVSATCP